MFVPPSCIDLLFDYVPLLSDQPLCQLPEKNQNTEVAIIGAGAAGLVAAYELLKMGCKPVIYEASSRIGGRLYSKHFSTIDSEHPPLAELGAMRLPKSSRIFFHYAKKMGIDNFLPFTGPGVLDTAIYYKGRHYHWHAHQEPPTPFKQIKLLWDIFDSQLIFQIHNEWKKNNNSDFVKYLWQFHIDQYKDKSFYEVIRERSPLTKGNQINVFGSLGIGGGGFSPLFNVGFLEILRFSVNRYLDDLYFLPTGVSDFIERLYRFPAPKKSLADLQCVKLNTSAINLDYNPTTKNPIIITKDKNNLIEKKEFRAVIFSGSVAAAQLINIAGKTKSGVHLLDKNVSDAVRSSAVFASSKTFIATKNKFWLKNKMPMCLLTDELQRAMYFFNYPQTEHGVVCLSYTWGSDALKLHAVDPIDRVVIFKRVIEGISPEINQFLDPINNEVINIDWVNEKYQNGAFNLFSPGSDERQRDLYYQFQSCLSPEDKGIYLAGDSVSWSAGWVEGALYTGLNAVYAVAKRLDAIIPTHSPLNQDPHLYRY